MPFSALFSDPLIYLIYLATLLMCISIHEFSHAFVADRLGDPTARSLGRVTLNPLAHLDPLGTLMMILFHFGWGKPVPFDPYNLKNPRRDSALIALAGPVSNLILAVVASIIFRFVPLQNGYHMAFFLVGLISLNVTLAIFNLLPLHPLDGGKILIGFAPKDVAREWDQALHKYGMFILIMLFLPLYNGISPLSALLGPIISFILKVLIG